MAKNQNIDSKKSNSKKIIYYLGRLYDTVSKIVCQFLKNLNISLPYDPAIMLLDIYKNVLENYAKTCTGMFTQTFFSQLPYLESIKLSLNK